MITRLAFQCPDGGKSDGICFETLSLNNLAGTHHSNGAVGSPDSLEPLPEGAPAHCDDADFLNIPSYPRLRANATAALQDCVDHLRMRFFQGIRGAARMLDGDNVRVLEVDISITECNFHHRSTEDDTLGRGNCIALEGFGRALHGTEDFYAHSNWADMADPTQPISVVNPPGLNRADPACFLDLRAMNNISSMIPRDLSTGCFNFWELLPFNGGTGSFKCRDRIAHLNLNKDHGIITTDGSITPDPEGVPRESVPGNFRRAVLGAVKDAKLRWENFRDELKRQYGADRANIMICALVRDSPEKDCRNRKISIVIDSSGSNEETDPSNLRIQAAKDFNAKLATASKVGPGIVPDKVAVIDFDDSAKVIYPMGDPEGAAGVFNKIDSLGGTDIGAGISAGIDEIMKEEPGLFAKRGGIIVLTDGEDNSPLNQITQLARAKLNGIRVNYGFLSPPPNPVPGKRSLAKRETDPDVIQAILRTGGTFGFIESAKAQQSFINLVIARGATDIDGSPDSTMLTSGVTVTEHVNPNKTSHSFTYAASAGERTNFTLTVVSGTTPLNAVLHDIRENDDISTVNATLGGPATIKFAATKKTELELIVSVSGNATSEVFFSVAIRTNMAEKNESTTTSNVPISTGVANVTTSKTLNTTTYVIPILSPVYTASAEESSSILPIHPNATSTFGPGSSTVTPSGPAVYTGGAKPGELRGMLGGVAGAIVALAGLGVL